MLLSLLQQILSILQGTLLVYLMYIIIKGKDDETEVVLAEPVQSTGLVQPDKNINCPRCMNQRNILRLKENSPSLQIGERIESNTTYISNEKIKGNYTNHYEEKTFSVLEMDFTNWYQESLESNPNQIDDPIYVDITNDAKSWKENWLFKKKHYQGPSKSVSMFIPNSNIEYRAMIGDQNIDETSDLSEYSSYSDEEIEPETINISETDFHEHTLKQCNEILVDYNSQCKENRNALETTLTNQEKLNSSTNCSKDKISISLANSEVNSSNFIINKNNTNNLSENVFTNTEIIAPPIIDDADGQIKSETEDKFIISSSEYDNRIDVTENDSIKGEQRFQQEEDHFNGFVPFKETKKELDSTNTAMQMFDSDTPVIEIGESSEETNLHSPKPGSIAEREHKKWENAVSIANNPYSKEKLQSRLMQSDLLKKSSDVSRFMRDYYYSNYSNNLKAFNNDNEELQQPITFQNQYSDLTDKIVHEKSDEYNTNPISRMEPELVVSIEEYKKDDLPTCSNIISCINDNISDAKQIIEDLPLTSNANNTEIKNENINENGDRSQLNNQKPMPHNEVNKSVFNKLQIFKENEHQSNHQKNLKQLKIKNNILPNGRSILNTVREQPAHKASDLHNSLNYLESPQLNESINRLENVNSGELLNKDVSNITVPRIKLYTSLSKVAGNKQNARVAPFTIQNKLKNQIKSTKSEAKLCKKQNDKFGQAKKNMCHETKLNNNLSNNSEHQLSETTFQDNTVNSVINKPISLPSVKKLVKIFNEKDQEQERSSATIHKPISELENLRSTSQEEQIHQSRRQMHSLTARFLSKEFREGLRQIPNTPNV